MAKFRITPTDTTKRSYTIEADEARVEIDTNAVVFFTNPSTPQERVVARLLNVSFRKL